MEVEQPQPQPQQQKPDIHQIGELVRRQFALTRERDAELTRIKLKYSSQVIDTHDRITAIKPVIFDAMRRESTKARADYMAKCVMKHDYRYHANYSLNSAATTVSERVKSHGRRLTVVTASPLCNLMAHEQSLAVPVLEDLGLMELFNVYRTCRALRTLVCSHLEHLVMRAVSRDTEHQESNAAFSALRARLSCLLSDYTEASSRMVLDDPDDTVHQTVPQLLCAAYFMHRKYRVYGTLTLNYRPHDANFINIHNTYLQESSISGERVIIVPLSHADVFQSQNYHEVCDAMIRRYREACGGDDERALDHVTEIRAEPLAYFTTGDWEALDLVPLVNEMDRADLYHPYALFILHRSSNSIRIMGNRSRANATTVARVFQINAAEDLLYEGNIYHTPINQCVLDRYELRLTVLGVKLYSDGGHFIAPLQERVIKCAFRDAEIALNRAQRIEYTAEEDRKKRRKCREPDIRPVVQRVVWRDGKLAMEWTESASPLKCLKGPYPLRSAARKRTIGKMTEGSSSSSSTSNDDDDDESDSSSTTHTSFSSSDDDNNIIGIIEESDDEDSGSEEDDYNNIIGIEATDGIIEESDGEDSGSDNCNMFGSGVQ